MLITHGRLVTWGDPCRILDDHALLVEAGQIAELGPTADLVARNPAAEVLDSGGQLILPGNICAHTHFYGAFARGMAIPGRAPADFPDILKRLWWPLDRSLTAEDIRYSALVCLVDAVRHGTTTLIDHHASPNAIEGSLDVIAEAVDQAGLRAVLCYEVTDRDGAAKAMAGIAENLRFLERCRRQPPAGGGLAASFGLHASLTLSDETLDRCRAALPEGAGFHLHAAEGQADQVDSLAKSGMRVVERLERHGILGERTILAHCVHVDAHEIELLAGTRTWVTHQPRSNMNNAVGVADVEAMRQAGVRVAMGNDGFSNAMWEEWKAAYLVHKLWQADPRRMSATTVVEMAVRNNAALAGQFFPEAPLGEISVGAAADLVLVDYHSSTPLTAENLPWHILFGFEPSMVTTTIAAGRLLMRDRRLLTLDEEQITRRSRELASAAWRRYHLQVPADERRTPSPGEGA